MTGYTDYVNQIATTIEQVVVDATSATPFQDPLYNTFLPRAILNAELRIYRDLDVLQTNVTDSTGHLTASARSFSLPTTAGTFLVVEEVIVLVGSTPQPPLQWVSKQFIDNTWPTNTPISPAPSVPRYVAPVDGTSVLVAPTPDIAYPVNVFGTIRPATLSPSNANTILTQIFSDLFFKASMIEWAGFQRENNPDVPMWEAAYDKAFGGADIEEFRKKLRSVGFSSLMPSPLAPQPGQAAPASAGP